MNTRTPIPASTGSPATWPGGTTTYSSPATPTSPSMAGAAPISGTSWPSKTTFPGAPVVRLEENFRSTPEVLRLADELIRANIQRKEKRLIARKPGGSLPRLYRFADEYEEARGVAAWVRWVHEGHGIRSRADRRSSTGSNAMSRLVEEELIKAAIPYQIVKGVGVLRTAGDQGHDGLPPPPRQSGRRRVPARVINRPARGIGDSHRPEARRPRPGSRTGPLVA